VDDPVWFGRIAAANSLSDVYAMGGRPLTALNLVMYPMKKLGPDVLKEILRGGHEKIVEAGASLAGGHSVDDEEPKYGLAVTGIVSPDRILTNTGVRPEDALILTKPLGTGVLFNANRSGKLPWNELEAILPEVASLNHTALQVALDFDIHGCTDITGFGILGHTLEMARGSGVQIELTFADLPFYANAADMYRKGETTGSNAANRKLVESHLEIRAGLSAAQKELLFDPQTSGGLLLSVPADQARQLVDALRRAGVTQARLVGLAMETSRAGIRII
jgi:selenide,water dikinase